MPSKRKVISNYDITLAMLVLFLSVFGLIMIYSTSSYNAARYYGKPRMYFDQQLKYLAVGLILMVVISLIDYRIYIRPLKLLKIPPVWLLYVLCLGLQVYVLINGYSAGGASRWIKLPGIGSFQPSELTKICIVLFTAYLVQKNPGNLNYFSGFLVIALFIGPLVALVAKQNLSTAIIMLGMMIAICFVVARKKKYFVIVGFMAVGFAALFVATAGYRAERIVNWLHPENLDNGSQILQGLYAIASGGLWGKGLGQSSQKLGYIPEVHTDMIFTVICEELGIIGAIAVIALFLMLLWRLSLIALQAPDMYGGLIATGVLVQIALQVLINIAVVTNSIPATGIPLPFISYGGTSLMVLMIEMGIVLSVSKYTDKESEDDSEEGTENRNAD